MHVWGGARLGLDIHHVHGMPDGLREHMDDGHGNRDMQLMQGADLHTVGSDGLFGLVRKFFETLVRFKGAYMFQSTTHKSEK